MTRDEVIAKWNSMQPREWDAWVAEEVMGLELSDNMLAAYPKYRLPDYPGYFRDVPNYSTDIVAAWEVLKKFKTYQITYSESGFSHSGMKYRVIVGRNQDVAYSDIETEAICLAALIATQGEGITE